MPDEIIELTDVVKPKNTQLDQFFEIIQQPSTWKGIIMLLGALGLQIDQEAMLSVIKAGAVLYGAISIVVDKH